MTHGPGDDPSTGDFKEPLLNEERLKGTHFMRGQSGLISALRKTLDALRRGGSIAIASRMPLQEPRLIPFSEHGHSKN